MTDFIAPLRCLVMSALLAVPLLSGCASSSEPRRAAVFDRLGAYERLGLESIDQDRWDRAYEYFSLAATWARSLDQRAAEARSELNLAWIEERSHQGELAEKRLQKLLAGTYAADVRGEAALRLSRLAADRGQLPSARTHLQQAMGLLPAGRSLWLARVHALRLDLQSGSLPDMLLLQRLSQEEGLAGERTQAMHLLAQAYLRQQQPAAALTALQQAWGLDHAAGRSSRLVQNLALQAEALALQQQVQPALEARERARLVCEGWLGRFAADARWRPRQCPGLPAAGS